MESGQKHAVIWIESWYIQLKTEYFWGCFFVIIKVSIRKTGWCYSRKNANLEKTAFLMWLTCRNLSLLLHFASCPLLQHIFWECSSQIWAYSGCTEVEWKFASSPSTTQYCLLVDKHWCILCLSKAYRLLMCGWWKKSCIGGLVVA